MFLFFGCENEFGAFVENKNEILTDPGFDFVIQLRRKYFIFVSNPNVHTTTS